MLAGVRVARFPARRFAGFAETAPRLRKSPQGDYDFLFQPGACSENWEHLANFLIFYQGRGGERIAYLDCMASSLLGESFCDAPLLTCAEDARLLKMSGV